MLLTLEKAAPAEKTAMKIAIVIIRFIVKISQSSYVNY
jgi:hypothetical protein